MCNVQEQRPVYFGWRQTRIIHTRLKDALQADEQVNKDRLVELGIEDSRPLRKKRFIQKKSYGTQQNVEKVELMISSLFYQFLQKKDRIS